MPRSTSRTNGSDRPAWSYYGLRLEYSDVIERSEPLLPRSADAGVSAHVTLCLAQAYETQFRALGLHTAQVLLTHADLADRARYLNARSTLFTLLELGVVPVIDEHDTVVTDEIKFGDNDTLAALVTNLIEADALVILTDQAGLFSADPRRDPTAMLVRTATAGEPALESMAGGAGSAIARGGMLTKVLAAKRAARSGALTIIIGLTGGVKVEWL